MLGSDEGVSRGPGANPAADLVWTRLLSSASVRRADPSLLTWARVSTSPRELELVAGQGARSSPLAPSSASGSAGASEYGDRGALALPFSIAPASGSPGCSASFDGRSGPP